MHRLIALGLTIALTAPVTSCAAARPPVGTPSSDPTVASLAAIESRFGGRLGVAALDAGTGRKVAFRGGERFAMASTFKWLLCAAVLARVDAGLLALDRKVAYTRADLLEPAPVTGAHVDEGALTVAELCQATIQHSDNPAANLLLPLVGGPAGLTDYLRRVGDRETRLDRNEPTLNLNLPGDPRDTSTPEAMVGSLHAILVGDALTPASRRQLTTWMEGTVTGLDRLRAGLPTEWRVGDKTGTGGGGATNDVAIAWPPGRAPLLIAAFFDASPRSLEERKQALMEVARVVATWASSGAQ